MATTSLPISCNVNIHSPKTPKTSKTITTYQNLKITPHKNTTASPNAKWKTTRISKTSAGKLNFSLTTTLLRYVESGRLQNALSVFDNMNKSDPFVWNIVIRALADKCLFDKAIDFYYRMQSEGVRADNFTFPFVIKACGSIGSLTDGEKVHARLIKIGLDIDLYICNALIIMYAKLDCIKNSKKIFQDMTVKDIVSWNSMISGYVSAGDGYSSLKRFREMQANGIRPDRFSIISSIGACSLENYLSSGKEIHCRVIRGEFAFDSMIQTSLIDLYGKSGQVVYSKRLFDSISQKSVVLWNAMIGAYVLNGKRSEALSCLVKMQERDCLAPDTITLINLLPSCSNLGELAIGKSIHAFAIRRGFLPHLVMETALVHMYGNCGSLKAAKLMFVHLKDRNLVSWNAMIAAYVQNSQYRVALELFLDLLNGSFNPDEMTITSILPAYAEIALPKEGNQIHGYISKLGFSSNTFVSNSMIYMYAKCGDLQVAQEIFELMSTRDVVSWNTVIMAYAIHGFGAVSVRLFSKMREEGVTPSASTFVSLLSACSIAGMVDEGWEFFHSMKRGHGIDPQIEHYGCMVDLLGHAGNLDLAKRFIDEMPLVPTARIWGSLLAASRHHRNIEVAEFAMHKISSLKHDNTGCYVLLSNMYAEAGRWEDVQLIKCFMKKQGLKRNTGCARIECNGGTRQFTNYDQSHTKADIIYDALNIISRKIGKGLHVSVSKLKPPDLIRRRENDPLFHSVRLAICSGLTSTPAGNPVLVRKNIRICEDCHDAAKKISEITKREIIVGDSKIYHHFDRGNCLCCDYW